MMATDGGSAAWPAAILDCFKAHQIRQVAYVPDAGHSELIKLCHADDALRVVPLTREEEGVGVSAGAWLGGERAVVLMQSSGVGNIINAVASLTQACGFPLCLLVTMRGEWGETNPWQVPMGGATRAVLEAVGTRVEHVIHPADVAPAVNSMLAIAFTAQRPVATLLGQRLIGAKSFDE